MLKMTTTRRAVISGAAMLAAGPALALGGLAAPESGMAALWRRAEDIKGRLGADMMALQAGVPGWMRAGGEASRLGEARYAALVTILNGKPAHAADLGVMAKAARETEMVHGPHDWANERFMQAALALHA